ncbi:hypothetical protein [Stieleria mannarensis]|uniref:hypothetical protein n=1 Tax=Stieleria mannarensis TaxID=2755585 RepID=UPI0015FECE6D|nr:hypothetical protein [Rhodopirellula sp. JC639]
MPFDQTSVEPKIADKLKSLLWVGIWTAAGAVLGTALAYILFGLAYKGWSAPAEQFAGPKPQRSGDPIDAWAAGVIATMYAMPCLLAGFVTGAIAGFRIGRRRHQKRCRSENRSNAACRVIVLPLLVLLGTAQSADADFGLKLMTNVRIDVHLDGRSLPDGAKAALLAPSPWSTDAPVNAAERVPGLVVPWQDEEGEQWNYAAYLWGGDVQKGGVTFSGFWDYRLSDPPIQGLPKIVRLAVYDPRTERLYVTSPASPGQHLALMRAELSSSGSGILDSLLIPFWQRLDFWKAMLITLMVECFIVIWVVCVSRTTDDGQATGRAYRKTRLIRVCLLVNLLTLPLVWFFGGEFIFRFGFWWGTATFLGLEAMAFLIEAVFYRGVLTTSDRTSRLPWSIALRASLLANLTTFLLGFVL